MLHGDEGAETFLSEIVNAPQVSGMRHHSMESLYDYGSHAGFWRVRKLFKEHGLPLTVYGVGRWPCSATGGGGGDAEIRLGDCQPRLSEEGELVYDSDSYADDLPYYDSAWGKPQLILPYTLNTNDMRFAAVQGFNTGEHFFNYVKDAIDALLPEGETCPKMLSIGLHCRIIGRPAHIGALRKILDYMADQPDVWVAKRIDIAREWLRQVPPPEA